MKVVLSVPGGPAGCLSMFPLLDRPFLQHVIEVLAGRGLTDVHFVLNRYGGAVERHLGDGRRWGGTFHYHLTPDPDRPAGALAAAAVGYGPVLIGKADRLPLFPDPLPAGRTLFDAGGGWTGWAVADAADLRGFSRAVTWSCLEPLLAGRRAVRVAVGRVLPLRSPADVPAACRALLRSEFPGVLDSGREYRPGVRVGRCASVSPAAVLVPPVFVGEGTSVRADAQVGPNAVVGPGCLIDTSAAVRNAVVLPGTHVGPGVELDGVIADRDHLIGPDASDVIPVDPHLLGELPTGVGVGSLAGRTAERLLAAAAFVLGLPVLATAAAWFWLTRPGPVFWRRRFIRDAAWREGTAFTLAPPGPADGRLGWVVAPTWRGLVQELLPALPAVAAGRLRLVGLPPRDPDLARRFEPPAAPAGLISEAGLIGPAGLSADDVLTLDAYQAQTSTTAADLGRVARFLAGVVAGRPAADPIPTTAAA